MTYDDRLASGSTMTQHNDLSAAGRIVYAAPVR
jgi:hypothetical protein